MSTTLSQFANRARALVRRRVHLIFWTVIRAGLAMLALGPDTATNLMAAVAEESNDTRATVEGSMLTLQGFVPLEPSTLVGQYIQGRVPFGFYGDEERVYWREIESRGLITAESAHVPKTVRQQMNRLGLDVKLDVDQEQIIRRCRREQGTWLNEAMIRTLLAAADQGLCTTIGGYRDGELVAGEFGLDLNGWFHGMSTFHTLPGAGNALFGYLITEVRDQGRFTVVDVGEMKPTMVRLGAVETGLAEFRSRLLSHLGHHHALA
jgi:leucyl/phenylalanyl-tRNA--protein transferase